MVEERDKTRNDFLGEWGYITQDSHGPLRYLVECHTGWQRFRSILLYLFAVFEVVCLDYIQPCLFYKKMLTTVAIYEEREWGHRHNCKNRLDVDNS